MAMLIAILAVFAYSSMELLNKLEEKDERKEAAKVWMHDRRGWKQQKIGDDSGDEHGHRC